MDPVPETPRSAKVPSGRSVLLRLLAAALVAGVALTARQLLLDDDPVASSAGGSRLIGYELDSKLIGETLPINVVIPPGATDGERSLLVFLHGRGSDEGSYLNSDMYAGLVAQQGKAPVVAFPRGGPDSYWHDRDDGDWGSYVLDELVPAMVERFDIEPERVAIGGISMGGFGAFDIARISPETFCTVGGHSSAVWENASQTAPGAFDDEQDFEDHDVIGLLAAPTGPLDGKRVWLDVGDDDPFLPANMAFEEALDAGGAKVDLVTGPGAHEDAYWNANWRRYFRFYATQLKRCQTREADGGEERRVEAEAGG